MALTQEQAAELMAKLEASVGPEGISSGLPQGYAGYPSPDAISTKMVGGTPDPMLRAIQWASVQATYEGGGDKPVITGQFATLKPGDHSAAVAELNKGLAAIGLYEGTPGNSYDAKTEKALADFAASHGMQYAGSVPHSLWQAVSTASGSKGVHLKREDRVLEEGMDDTLADAKKATPLRGIKDLQAYLGIAPTGHFGPAEKEATGKWQGAHGLPVTGVVDGATMAAMNADIVTKYDERIQARAAEILDCMKATHISGDQSGSLTPINFTGAEPVGKGCIVGK